ncbi:MULTISPECIES: molybdenum cofactor guanylyltransferase [unclassified Psychrobacter]|uniref:molybdenum cofactor guanylyltransferase n=1 Tax=unclassified Psychrobacter TaxID=196806 RepID=UPI000ED31E07|nr:MULTISPECIES: NTP transferase domain-containing protein [unclassified Psychrobacter]MBE8609637.1 NTP transferase domain-containing protein [Pseudomonas lundensis]HCI76287.1 molybdenum cofactor guanylyltransferase [Psychrobacter sp.]
MLEVTDSLIEVDRFNHLAGIVILAGGASKRMGTPKAELILPTGERLVDYHVRQALELSAAMISNLPIMIADNGRGFTITPDFLKKNPQSPVFHISDYLSVNNVSVNNISSNELSSSHNKPIETGGALAAIEAALQSLKSLASSNQLTKDANWQHSWLMVISCDSLIPVTDLWQKLQPYMTENPDKTVICLTDDSHLYPLLGLYRLDMEPDLKHYIDDEQRQVMKFIQPIVQPVPFAKNWQYLTNFNTPKDFEHACLALNDL